ncbi:MAG: cation transporter [Gemmatimonadaceae bacterium]
MERVTLAVGGMSCAHCVRAVDEALKSVDGVEVEGVTIGSATVAYDPTKVTMGTLIDAVSDAGYEAQEGSPA